MSEKPGFNADAWTRFWTDAMSAMSTAAMGQAFAGSPEEAARKLRQAFFDAWAKACDDYLHSDQFLDLMKQSMDGALAFREQMNRFLVRAFDEGVAPSRGDTDAILQTVRTLEERVMDRLDELSQRVAALESKRAARGKAARPATRGKRKGSSR